MEQMEEVELGGFGWGKGPRGVFLYNEICDGFCCRMEDEAWGEELERAVFDEYYFFSVSTLFFSSSFSSVYMESFLSRDG